MKMRKRKKKRERAETLVATHYRKDRCNRFIPGRLLNKKANKQKQPCRREDQNPELLQYILKIVQFSTTATK